MPNQVGRSVQRLESAAKVTGRAEYIHNLELPGMLYGKIVRSTVAHGLLRGIDTTDAEKVSGVVKILTSADVLKIIPDPYYGPAFHDQPILAMDKVRYVGEPVALVLARDESSADQAADLVDIEYEELDAVYDEVESADEEAPVIHDFVRPAGTFTDLKNLKSASDSNISMQYRLRHGDTARGFEQADYVFEDTFRSQQVMHTPLEPIVSVAELKDTGTLIVHTASQSPSFVRTELARLLGWPENKVRVRTAFLGGGFGAKLYMKLEALVSVASLIVRKPVKISLTMEEQFYTITRHGATVWMKTGVTKDGKIVARHVKTWWNGGAYADIGPRVTQKSGFTAAGPYDIENVDLDSMAVYTNLPPAGALRGFGIPQLVWAYESQADIIASKLGIDPLEFRWKNLLENGRPHATNTILQDAGTVEVLRNLQEKMNWESSFDRGNGKIKRGRGIALGLKAAVTPTTSVAMVSMLGDGSCAVYCGTVDMGQGSDTAMGQVAAEVLGIQAEDVKVIHPDTDVTPYDMATLGSRSMYHMGNAIKLAAEDLRKQVVEFTAKLFDCRTTDLILQDGKVSASTGENLTLAEFMVKRFGMQAGNLVGVGTYTPTYKKPDPDTGESEDITTFWMVGGTGAEVEVDTETGKITITKLVNLGDTGKAINPDIVRSQLSGAAIMQLGFTMFEQMKFEEGQVINASFADYKVPGILDVPQHMNSDFVEVPVRTGPFGGKGIGEVGSLALTPAVGNAVFDAIGVRIKELPLTPEKVLRALSAQNGKPLEDE